MTFGRAATAAAMALTTVLTLQGFVPYGQAPTPQSPPPAVPPAGERGAAPQGRGGGRGNATATLFTEICAGCHGTTITGGRAPSLFDDQWSRGADDESIARNIENGVPTTEMPPFKGALTDQQIWQLVAYIRTQAATLKGRPQYVPDPDNQVIKSEKQTFKIEIVARGIETPWGLAFLPDGRLLVTERPGRLRIIENGQAPARGEGAAEGLGEAGWRHVRRRSPSAVRAQRVDLPRRTRRPCPGTRLQPRSRRLRRTDAAVEGRPIPRR